MKRTTFFCALLLALVMAVLVAGQERTKSKGPQAGGVEQQLEHMEDDWAKAIKDKDAVTLRRIIAEDWVGAGDNGKVSNREQGNSQMTSNPDVIESNENFDMQVRVYGNTAVVIGGGRERGTRNGTAYTDTYRWTDVFVKRGGHWQAVVSQFAKVP
ncbi:MAG: nuclear transport factor 2 family protein [Acidobacteriota bacterium]